MKYQSKSFSVAYGSKAYRDSWERMFGNQEPKKSCATCKFLSVSRTNCCWHPPEHGGCVWSAWEIKPSPEEYVCEDWRKAKDRR